MVEYMVLKYKEVPDGEKLNALAQEAWRVVAVTGATLGVSVCSTLDKEVMCGSVVLEREKAR